MKVFKKECLPNGRVHIYFCGVKIASYKKRFFNKYQLVSLGFNCLPRTVLTLWGVKPTKGDGELSYPFDLAVHSLPGVIDLLKADFKNYFTDVVWNETRGFYTKKDDSIRFNHDTDLKSIDELKERFKHRVENFRNLRKSKKHLIFVIAIDFSNYETPLDEYDVVPKERIEKINKIQRDLHELKNVLKHYFKRNKFSLMVIDTLLELKPSNDYILIQSKIPSKDYALNWWKYEYISAPSGKTFEGKIVAAVKRHIAKIQHKENILSDDEYNALYANRFFNTLTLEDKKDIIRYQFFKQAGYIPDIDNPKTFNEKMQWLKLNYLKPLMTKCADKISVRDYVAEKIGQKYLVPCLGVWDNPEDIDFDKLPNKFVLKVNHGSGQNIIVDDKTKFNISDAVTKLKEWMKPENNWYYYSFENVYKDIKPKIIAEEFLETSNNDLPDYKIMCYDGIPKNLFVCSERRSGLKVTFFDLNWDRLPFNRMYPVSKNEIKKPKNFDEMLKISKILSRDFPFVRVDFFEVNEKLYIGEMTFYPGNGMEPFNPCEWDRKLGNLLKLPKKPSNI